MLIPWEMIFKQNCLSCASCLDKHRGEAGRLLFSVLQAYRSGSVSLIPFLSFSLPPSLPRSLPPPYLPLCPFLSFFLSSLLPLPSLVSFSCPLSFLFLSLSFCPLSFLPSSLSSGGKGPRVGVSSVDSTYQTPVLLTFLSSSTLFPSFLPPFSFPQCSLSSFPAEYKHLVGQPLKFGAAFRLCQRPRWAPLLLMPS